MNKYEKKHILYQAKYVKNMIEKELVQDSIKIFYIKRDEKNVKRIFTDVLGEDIEKIVFEERSLTESEKRLQYLKWILGAFMMFVISIPIILMFNLFFGLDESYLDLYSYFGNVIGLGCSLYVLYSSMKVLKSKMLFLVGILCVLFNLAYLIEFLYQYVL